MSLMRVAAIVIATVLISGCVSVTAVESVNGKAYVRHGHLFHTEMLYCDASDGNPECWPVKEIEIEEED